MTKEEIQKNSEHWYNKYKELERELTVEKDLHQEEINLHLHAEDYIKSLEKENKTLEGCLLAEQEHTQMLEQQIEKMKCCGNCRFDYCERSSECIDKDGNRTFHCWNEEKERYCDVGKEGKYQCWEIKRK